jgi:hypothetical protein
MFNVKTILMYCVLLIKSREKKNFTSLGKIIGKSHDTVSRLLPDKNETVIRLQRIAQHEFRHAKKLFLSGDNTKIKKEYSSHIEGTSLQFDSAQKRSTTGYDVFAGMLSDGKRSYPIYLEFVEKKEANNPEQTTPEHLKMLIRKVQEMFPDKEIVVVLDGAFATIDLITWFLQNNVNYEGRIHKNRRVTYKGNRVVLSEIAELIPVGRQCARTIKAVWHELTLYFTAQKRVDKHGNITIVYQVATYHDKPINHVNTYKKRWEIEKFFRTIKQKLGLQDCFSTKKSTQINHVLSVAFAYSLTRLEQKRKKLPTPEDALRALKLKKVSCLIRQFSALEQIFRGVYA